MHEVYDHAVAMRNQPWLCAINHGFAQIWFEFGAFHLEKTPKFLILLWFTDSDHLMAVTIEASNRLNKNTTFQEAEVLYRLFCNNLLGTTVTWLKIIPFDLDLTLRS